MFHSIKLIYKRLTNRKQLFFINEKWGAKQVHGAPETACTMFGNKLPSRLQRPANIYCTRNWCERYILHPAFRHPAYHYRCTARFCFYRFSPYTLKAASLVFRSRWRIYKKQTTAVPDIRGRQGNHKRKVWKMREGSIFHNIPLSCNSLNDGESVKAAGRESHCKEEKKPGWCHPTSIWIG